MLSLLFEFRRVQHVVGRWYPLYSATEQKHNTLAWFQIERASSISFRVTSYYARYVAQSRAVFLSLSVYICLCPRLRNDLDFKITTFFDIEYLRNDTR